MKMEEHDPNKEKKKQSIQKPKLVEEKVETQKNSPQPIGNSENDNQSPGTSPVSSTPSPDGSFAPGADACGSPPPPPAAPP